MHNLLKLSLLVSVGAVLWVSSAQLYSGNALAQTSEEKARQTEREKYMEELKKFHEGNNEQGKRDDRQFQVNTPPPASARMANNARLVAPNGKCAIRRGFHINNQREIAELFFDLQNNKIQNYRTQYETEEDYRHRVKNSAGGVVVVRGFRLIGMKYDLGNQRFLLRDEHITGNASPGKRAVIVRDARVNVGVRTVTDIFGSSSSPIMQGDIFAIIDSNKKIRHNRKKGAGVIKGMYYTTFKMDSGPDSYNDVIFLNIDKNTARINHGKLRTAYVISPKSQPTRTMHNKFDKFTTERIINAKIHCGLILDKDNNVVKVLPLSERVGKDRKRKLSLHPQDLIKGIIK